ncbi:MAG: 50S ribosomal protein L32 [Chloroflexota bacterium]
MGPLPKRKLSKGRRDRRRSQDRLHPVQLVPCPQCKELRPPHTVCPHCGTYQGHEVLAIEEE